MAPVTTAMRVAATPMFDTQEGERHAHRERVDAGRDGEDEQLAQTEGIARVGQSIGEFLDLDLLGAGLPDHLAADDGEDDERDPGREGLHERRELDAGGPPDQGHEPLEPSEESGDEGRPTGVEPLQLDALADAHGGGVHGEAHGYQQQFDQAHGALLNSERKAGSDHSEPAFGGRHWVRTSDLFRVREARYHCASRPRWRRDLNPCTRICSPLPRLSATPPVEPASSSRDETLSERTTGFEPATLTLAR